MGISERLKAERTRKGLTQTEFGALGGVTKNSQSNYESGQRAPDSNYLSLLAEHGVDVQFIITGKITQTLEIEPRLAALLDNVMNMNEEDRRCIERLASSLSQQIALKAIGDSHE